jgi:hypothetical protein
MIAVLEDAVHTYLKTSRADGPERRALYAETAAWFADRDASWFYSFENVCAVLDVDPDYVRRGLRAVKVAREPVRRPPAEEPAEEPTFRRASGD